MSFNDAVFHHKLRPRAGLVIGIACVAAWCFGPSTYHLVRLTILQHRLDRRLAGLVAERARLEQEHDRLKTDPTYVEGLIRSTFKLAQPGEYVIPVDHASKDHRDGISAQESP